MTSRKEQLDQLYKTYNRKEYVSPDPLQFLYDYPDVRDREIVGLIASSLAYGRVAQILKSVDKVLTPMGKTPYDFLADTPNAKLKKIYKGFKHRFTTDEELVSLLNGMRKVINKHGSLNGCFIAGANKSDETIISALQHFTDSLQCEGNYLIPSPAGGSACKRLHLFLRWMVRKDTVDPGGWKGVSKAKLIVPLDTHMARIGQMMGFTHRKTANIKMAKEITDSLAQFYSKDPVKYDFALTRFGIREELSISSLKQA
ncbi:TIGR02757 family protein [bacterium B17]|nr:TIGR02757 family protein [bacterium B17]